ncbi:arylamine N-acetyltransferase [Paenibacillus sp. HWE-109]|uniref:arylamine N-acetyltransferase family protein n=1 Tax=Paenibacillus sp. HWE-109 TaxID=1306526 RepID=UPI001EDE4228|nr:arylamine N-acetyltransferase [Paenibacillus sp. HWE-109]UKS25900.1 arylamine N-acetyltransferase [Paenibacillus sp. HWE-109]
MLTQSEIKTYLHRLGVSDIESPTKDYLFALHQAHVDRISWQTLDIYAGKPVSIDTKEAVHLMLSGRSGYCFHLNGAFSTLLQSLGYKISMHRAGVQPLGQEPRINSFHLGLTVDLATDPQEEDRWIIDVGLGDMPYEPIPWLHGRYDQAPFTYTVTESGVVPHGWRLEHDKLGPYVGVDYAPEVVSTIDVFKPQHAHYSLSPDSPWMNIFLLRQRHATGGNELRGCVWHQRELDQIRKTELTTQSQWLEVLGDVFGEHLVAYSSHERDALWQRIHAEHEVWKRQREERV